MSRRTRDPRSDIERYMRHYGCSYAEAQVRVARGDPLPTAGTGLRTGRAATRALTSDNISMISTVLGIVGAIFGSISLLIRIFEKEESA